MENQDLGLLIVDMPLTLILILGRIGQSTYRPILQQSQQQVVFLHYQVQRKEKVLEAGLQEARKI